MSEDLKAITIAEPLPVHLVPVVLAQLAVEERSWMRNMLVWKLRSAFNS